MKFFSREELIGISIIMSFILVLSFFNFRLALRRARDAQRRGDLSAISNALNKFHDDFGFFPPTTDEGKILACPKDNYSELAKEATTDEGLDLLKYFEALEGCNWGVDGFRDLEDSEYPPYLATIPQDPSSDKGTTYIYLSNSKRYQIYAYLEGGDEENGYSEGIEARNLSCGDKICSFGKSFGATPLEKSIEKYENELLEESRLRMEAEK